MKLNLIPAIFMFYGFLSIAYAITLLLYFSKQKNRSIQNCAIGAFLMGFSVLLTIFRTEIPLWLSYVVANAIAFTAYRYFNYSMINLGDQHPNLRPSLLRSILIGAIYCTCLHFIGITLGSGYQTIFVSLAVTYLLFEGGFLSLKIYNKYQIDLIKIYAFLFFVPAGLWLCRIILVALDIATVAFDAHILNTSIFMALFLTGIFRYMLYPIVLLKITESEKENMLIDRLVWANKTAETGALSASIAHELNQPLGAIQINSEFLRLQLSQGKVDESLLKELADKIVSDNTRAGSIIQSLRSIFRSEKNSTTSTDLGNIVQTVLQITGPELSRKKINVKLRLASHTVSHVNTTEIQQVVLNLLNNAINALTNLEREDKEISIETRHENETNTLTITDNGPGIPKSHQAMLFELTSGQQRNGMGLGLWLCKQIVCRNSGSINYADMPSGGAKFIVRLPAEVT
jgi:signal transduction histidine kinase